MIKPFSNNVLVEIITKEQKTETGVLLPNSEDAEKMKRGKVMIVGPGKIDKDSLKLLPMIIKKGDIVYFLKFAPTSVQVDGKEYFFVSEDNIMGKD